MNYPIFLSGRQAGKLNISRDGLYTLFQARMSGVSGLYRIWLQGEEGFAALGLTAPGPGGGLMLCRRLSRLEMKALPGRIERVLALAPDAQPEAAKPPKQTEKAAESPPEPEPGPGERVWLRRPDGSLTAREGGRQLIALPAAMRRAAPGVRLLEIEGRMYMVFRY